VKNITASTEPPTELILIDRYGNLHKFSITDAADQEICYLKNECLEIKTDDLEISINDIRIIQTEKHGLMKKIKGYLPYFRKYQIPDLTQMPPHLPELKQVLPAEEEEEEKPKPQRRRPKAATK